MPLLESVAFSAIIVAVSVGFTDPQLPRQPRLEHVRDIWVMHRPHRPHAILIAALYDTDAGRELRVGFTLDNLIHTELSCKGDEPLEARSENIRVTLREQGWTDVTANA